MRSILRRGIAPLLALIGIVAAGHAAGLPLIVYSAHTTQRIVALTFDDGPSSYTTSVLAVLRRWRMPATFFVIGSEAAAHPALVRAEVEAGYAIGNHTYTHADLLRLSGKALATQVDETQAAVWKAAHVRPHWLRPPYGAIDRAVATSIHRLGLGVVLWSVDPRDWARPGTSAIVQRVMAQLRPGAIILMHDGGGNRSETVRALPIILADLHARGYRILPLNTLLGYKPPTGAIT